MRKLFFLFVVSFMLSGCGTGLKSRWGNFTAYYNTYYNAKKSYGAGLKKVLEADQNYNPQQPIRVHETPINAGTQDFDKAIDKGAEILRKHGDTKWVDNSLLLIGKSYFFKKEYFSADQKFEELLVQTDDETLIQESILWKARTLLEMELYGQGIQYINQELNDREDNWKKGKRAELELILAQIYVAQENWLSAIDLLNKSLDHLNSKKYKERGYFLLGQLNERQGNYREAFRAFSEVQNFYTDYDLQYLSLRKTAETARILGDNDTALNTFNRMVKDDKNTEFVSELDYEIARTYQTKKEFKTAENIYKKILQNEINQPDAETKALTYNGLAEVYRFGYDDLEMAAAYYDTASRQNATMNELPEDFNATELAISFGEYSELKNEIAYRDSLIWVSNLSKVELDSLISEIKKRKLNEIEEARRNQEQQQNTLVNLSAGEQEQTNTGNNGFLNVNSPELQNNARTQFIAVWGNRPLTDNWRVSELIQAAVTSDITENTDGINNGQISSTQSFDTSIDLSEVPFQEDEKNIMRQEIATYKFELGNLFYISLNMPDSAVKYFEDVIENHIESDKVPVSYYSLSEIQSLSGNSDEARSNAKILVDAYPDSRYAERLAEKYGLLRVVTKDTLNLSLADQVEEIKADTSLSTSMEAEKVSEIALANTANSEAAPILYEAIQLYISAGRQDTIYKENFDKWNEVKKEFLNRKTEFLALKDSLKIQIQDTSLTDAEILKLQSVIDSTLTEPDYSELFPYYGDNWENARNIINLFLTNFGNSKLSTRVQILKEELAKPKVEEAEVEQNPELESTDKQITDESVIACTELGNPPQIRGGIENFMESMDNFETEETSITYTIQINQRGIVEGLNLVSDISNERIINNYNGAIRENLVFEPVLENGQAVSVTCNYTFPVK